MSNKIRVVPFEQIHLSQIDVKENYSAGEIPRVVMSSAFTLIRDDTVMAILGGFPFIPGVIHFWALIAKQVRECPIDFHKNCLKILAWYDQYEKPRRIQFEVRASYVAGCRWAESLGLSREGLLKKWAPDGEDCYLYARVNTWQP